MQCADLDRYLESFLDGRLGRSRSLMLRRHLAGCLACRARFERLRQFERDLAGRLRSLERCDSLWGGLELDLVKSGETALPRLVAPLRALPPPRASAPPPAAPVAAGRTLPPRPSDLPRPRRLRSSLIGLAVAAVAAGAAVQTGLWLLDGSGAPGGALALLDRLKGEPALELRNGDPAALRGWLTARLAAPVPALPIPAGFELLGGRIDELGGLKSGVLVYRRGGETALLYLQPRPGIRVGEVGTDLLAKLQGGARLAWQDEDFSYAVVSTLPAGDLVGLGRTVAVR
jgi:anti-sigma factor RsiW